MVNTNTTTAADSNQKKIKIFNFMEEKINTQQTTSNNSATDSLMNIKLYLDRPNEKLQSNPLKFWREYDTQEELKELAKQYLGIQASSVPSERLFSNAGNIADDKRNRLKPCNLSILSFFNQNLPVLGEHKN